MGMDLKPKNGGEWLSYNWTGWRYLASFLHERGVDVSEFRGVNDGDPICETTCRRIADVLETSLPSMSDEDRRWLGPHIEQWRTSGGFEQN